MNRLNGVNFDNVKLCLIRHHYNGAVGHWISSTDFQWTNLNKRQCPKLFEELLEYRLCDLFVVAPQFRNWRGFNFEMLKFVEINRVNWMDVLEMRFEI